MHPLSPPPRNEAPSVESFALVYGSMAGFFGLVVAASYPELSIPAGVGFVFGVACARGYGRLRQHLSN